MLNKRIENIIKVFNNTQEEQYPESLSLLKEIEWTLHIVFPNDFITLLTTLGYPQSGLFPIGVGEIENGLCSETLWYRENQNLSNHCVILEQNETSWIVMETRKNANKDTPILECDWHDSQNFIDKVPLTGRAPYYFTSFTDFYVYALNVVMAHNYNETAESLGINDGLKDLIQKTGKELNLKVPYYFDYEVLLPHSTPQCSFANATKQTLLYRKNYFLPNQYIVLNERNHILTLMDMDNDFNPIIKCEVSDIGKLKEDANFMNESIWYDSFGEFYGYLLGEYGEYKGEK